MHMCQHTLGQGLGAWRQVACGCCCVIWCSCWWANRLQGCFECHGFFSASALSTACEIPHYMTRCDAYPLAIAAAELCSLTMN